MSPNSKLWMAALGAAVVGVLLGAGGLWAAQQSTNASLNARVIQADANTQSALQTIDELTAQLQATKAGGDATSTGPGTTEPSSTTTPAKKPAAKPAKAVRQFTFIKKVTESSSGMVITADYAQMLSGDAAAAAATDHGDESPPPNDYYIVNDNKLLRKLKVKSGISVTVTTNPDGTTDPSGHFVTLANWASNYSAPTSDNASLREAPYWITVQGSTITKIEQQYLP